MSQNFGKPQEIKDEGHNWLHMIAKSINKGSQEREKQHKRDSISLAK